MSYVKRSMVLALVIVLCALFAGNAAADDMARSQTQAASMMHKFGRGVVNVLTGWIEVPKNISKEIKETDPFSGVVVGTVKGIGWGWGRTFTGVYDVFTSPLPIPEKYEPLMEPEFILPDLWGAELPDEPL